MSKFTQDLRVSRSSATLDDLDEMLEAFRQYSYPTIIEEESSPGRIVAIRVEVEADDLWELRDRLDDLKNEVEQFGHALVDMLDIDRKHVT